MEQYIPKSALVVEIERRLDELYELLPDAGKVEKGMITISEACNTGKYTALESFKNYIDTPEVKEVDLKKEIDDFMAKEWDGVKEEDEPLYSMIKNDLTDVAEHFFELGLKAQKDNIRHSMDETPKYPCDILLITNVDNVFLYRYMENGRPVDKDTPYFNNILNGKCWYYSSDIING